MKLFCGVGILGSLVLVGLAGCSGAASDASGGTNNNTNQNNSAPVAQSVALVVNTTPANVGSVLTASYTYFDADGDAQGASAIRWLRNGTAITGASGKSYTAVNDDAGQLIVFEVTPKAASGVLSGSATPSNGVAIIKTYTVGGTVSNLIGNGLSLSLSSNNTSTETLAISVGMLTFTFGTSVASGSTYTLTITTNPTGQTCEFANSTNTTTGSVRSNPVSEALSCTAPITSKLNDTGITDQQCYQAGVDTLVPCIKTFTTDAPALNDAQDGMVGRDANVATNGGTDGKLGFSFASVAGGCVQDNVTGLMWEVKTADGGLRDWTHTYTHYDSTTTAQKSIGTAPTQAEIDAATNSIGFKNSVNNQTLCGFSDWRLPTVDELQSIVDYGVAAPAPAPLIDATWFPNTQGGVFWSASPYAGSSDSAWVIGFGSGQVYGGLRYGSGVSVRLVRAGQSPTLPRYIVSADEQEVADSQTHLIWRRCPEGMVFSGGTCTGTAGAFTHEAALMRARDQASSTSIAWRLPNVKELASIADRSRSRSNPAIDSTAFPATPAGYFWSASPFVGYSSFARYVNFYNGNVDDSVRSNSVYVRLVRAGQ